MNDDTIIFYHWECGWRDEPRKPGFAMVNECPDCRRGGLSFVIFKTGSEDQAALAIINHACGQSRR
jgi:hypothetical protein